MANEIPIAYLRELVLACDRLDIDVEPLLRRHKIARRGLLEGRGRADWSTGADFLATLEQMGGDLLLTRIGESYSSNYSAGRILASLVLSPRALLELLLRLSARAGHPHLVAEWRDLPDGRFLFEASMAGGYPDCRAFFAWTTGFLRGVAMALELPPPPVDATIGPRGGRYLVRYPPRRTPREALLDALGAVRSDLLFEELLRYAPSFLPGVQGMGATDGILLESARESRVLVLQRRFQLTPAEARVAVRLSEGLMPSDIAAAQGVSVETIRTHLKRSYDKTGVRSQAQLVTLVHRLPD